MSKAQSNPGARITAAPLAERSLLAFAMARSALTAAALCAALLVLALPVSAQTPDPAPIPGPKPPATAPSLIDEGARLFLRGLLDQLGPKLEGVDLSGQLALLRQLGTLLSEYDQFEPPEVLPNGDVLIRRKPSLPPGPQFGPKGETDL